MFANYLSMNYTRYLQSNEFLICVLDLTSEDQI